MRAGRGLKIFDQEASVCVQIERDGPRDLFAATGVEDSEGVQWIPAILDLTATEGGIERIGPRSPSNTEDRYVIVHDTPRTHRGSYVRTRSYRSATCWICPRRIQSRARSPENSSAGRRIATGSRSGFNNVSSRSRAASALVKDASL